MKKLMIAVCAVALSAAANAAMYSWDASYVMNGYAGGSAAVDGDAYLFLNKGETALTLVQAAVEGGTFLDADFASLDTALIEAGMIGSTSPDGVAGATGDSFYMVLVGENAGTKYAYVSPTYTPEVVETIGGTSLSFMDDETTPDWGLWTSTSASGSWYQQGGVTPTPEPTSGLLLLLGVAGLALKRKRA